MKKCSKWKVVKPEKKKLREFFGREFLELRERTYGK